MKKTSKSQTPIAEERQTLSVEQAGRILGISRGLAYKLAYSGQLPTVRLGGRILVPKQVVERLLSA